MLPETLPKKEDSNLTFCRTRVEWGESEIEAGRSLEADNDKALFSDV